MPRLHLYEFNDQPWLPAPVRVGMTDYLATISRLAKLHQPMTPLLRQAIEDSGAERIIDLCAGSGGPLAEILPDLPGEIEVLLTDLHPAASGDALPARMRWHPEPVDALDCQLPGLRTLFNAFHHFRPEQARQILRSAFEQRQPIAIFESTSRSASTILTFPLIGLFVLLLVPAIRPVRPATFALTYLLPVLPALITWDGLVSHLRTYTVAELQAMTAELQAPDYRWSAAATPAGPGAWITSLIGVPVR